MQFEYFKTTWNDIRHSPKWFGKLCLLALLNFVPVFGQMVAYGYSYAWAREMAWGVHQPMPANIFCNEDGKFWRRGWFLFVISFVFLLIPGIITYAGQIMQQYAGGNTAASVYGVAPQHIDLSLYMYGFLVYSLGVLISTVIRYFFVGIAFMRATIYDRLSAGFQLGKIWKMLRYDTKGILKIFGMNLIVSILMFLAFMVAMFVVVVPIAIAIAAGTASASESASMALLFFVVFTLVLALAYFFIVGLAFQEVLNARALGYWTLQFNVAQWGGQDDPMPFERTPGVLQ